MGTSTMVDNHSLMLEIAKAFINNDTKKKVWGNFRIEGDTLIYRTWETADAEFRTTQCPLSKKYHFDKETRRRVNEYIKDFQDGSSVLVEPEKRPWDFAWTLEDIQEKLKGTSSFTVRYKYQVENTVAMRIKGHVFANAAILPLIGRTVSFGRTTDNRGQTVIQKMFEGAGADMIPFSQFSDTELQTVQVIYKGEPENFVIRHNLEGDHVKGGAARATHFNGTLILKYKPDAEDKEVFILIDLDRGELEKNLLNIFFVRLPGEAYNPEQAYGLLMPDYVKEALVAGKKVERMGECFFVLEPEMKVPELSHDHKILLLAQGNFYNSWAIDQFIKAGRDQEKFLEKSRKDVTDSISRTAEILIACFGDMNKAEKFFKDSEKIHAQVPILRKFSVANNTPVTLEKAFTYKKHMYCWGSVTHDRKEHVPLQLDGGIWRIEVNTAVIRDPRTNKITGSYSRKLTGQYD